MPFLNNGLLYAGYSLAYEFKDPNAEAFMQRMSYPAYLRWLAFFKVRQAVEKQAGA